MRIAILACPRVQLLDVIGPSDVFAEAARQLGNPRAYRVDVIALEEAPVKGSSGLKLLANHAISRYRAKIDTLLVAGSPYIDVVSHNVELISWLQRQARQVRRIGSVCSGAFILGAAGLLEGKRVTTHWNAAQRLAEMFPAIEMLPDQIYVKDGNLYTSAGVTAGMDLALAMVEEDHGRDLALRVARELVMFLKRPGGQSQFSTFLAAQATERSMISGIQDYVLHNVSADLSVPTLALRARMSERNFSRIFKLEAAATPAEFVEAARIDVARRLIEELDIPLKSIAARSGFKNVDSMRRAFVRRMQVNPAQYRQRFHSVS
jgi:transcriptional regulator GlxA family with amidase domain